MEWLSFLLLIQFTISVTNSKKCDLAEEFTTESLANGANDVIVVQQSDGSYKSTPFSVQIGKFATWQTFFKSRQGRLVDIEINGVQAPVKMAILDSGAACFTRQNNQFDFSSEEFLTFNLRPGRNMGMYRAPSLGVEIPFDVYLYSQTDQFVVTDVDGTITSSNTKGHVLPRIGFNADHDSVVELLDKVDKTNRHVIYLTARPMAMDTDTREYLFETLQYSEGQYSLPYGPLFLNPKPTSEALVEAVTGPQVQKILTLRYIISLFESGPSVVNGAYGNTPNDREAYIVTGIDPGKVFTVNEAGTLTRASDGAETSYQGQSDIITELYPSV
ncbi:hypothetical protein TCAL_09171 [Tigriopus californicus]|uniref:LNS2/PITP domain-containing protein n=1 Tax=Tigriopus californicus TaxID=6832 RepID=A0A553P612_TIGCA|nr:phosphatidate phosphatase LPIN3-like [Tigriopus californicus]TRY73126.1 hypothetical protein TCAL_09171 [Tigriopus californicus]|eukprot:TCALIF_09171-PA protein Name:"Similar to LPIN3 Phosphatidate phosphatase LPIN3 (Homo sapiens)" AED:0.00 eAED:0.00 QI:474/1/1/1/1/1/3/82/329